MMFPCSPPGSRGAHYFVEAIACLGIAAYVHLVDDPGAARTLSQRDEELMHFMEEVQDRQYCTTAENQPVEDTLDFAPSAAGESEVRIDYGICNSCGLAAKPRWAIAKKYLSHGTYTKYTPKNVRAAGVFEYCPARALVHYEL
jgi:hypothetical protein